MSKARTLFVSHGGGPLPLLGDPAHEELVACLKQIATRFPKPAAILVISAHWETAQPSLIASAQPGMLYDYYGFPDAAYTLQYPCPGYPALATRAQDLLQQAGFAAQLDHERGFDHGLYVPLALMYPEADIPCIQLSLNHRLDAADHLRLGKALQGLVHDDLLILGSGFSFHNMRAFFAGETPETSALNSAFENWLGTTCCDAHLTQAEREQRLINWEAAPGARYCHPRAEHLMPLQVCMGFAGRAASEAFHIRVLGKQASLFLW